jgi:cysteinyl-tRNA synthetase
MNFNTRAAISEVFELVRETNRLLASGELSAQGAKNQLDVLERWLELGILPSEEAATATAPARSSRYSSRSATSSGSGSSTTWRYKIRDRLKEKGVELQDTA